MKNINPIEIYGSWKEGYAMDLHTLSSEYLYDDEYGHPKFDTVRSYIGELVYKLKYQGNRNAVSEIVSLISPFLKEWQKTVSFDAIISMPPSNKTRTYQPVFEVANALAIELDILVTNDYLEKISNEESKNASDKSVVSKSMIRKEIFKKNVNVLLFDDLYASGASMNEAIRLLKKDEKIQEIYVLALTKKRS